MVLHRRCWLKRKVPSALAAAEKTATHSATRRYCAHRHPEEETGGTIRFTEAYLLGRHWTPAHY